MISFSWQCREDSRSGVRVCGAVQSSAGLKLSDWLRTVCSVWHSAGAHHTVHTDTSQPPPAPTMPALGPTRLTTSHYSRPNFFGRLDWWSVYRLPNSRLSKSLRTDQSISLRIFAANTSIIAARNQSPIACIDSLTVALLTRALTQFKYWFFASLEKVPFAKCIKRYNLLKVRRNIFQHVQKP